MKILYFLIILAVFSTSLVITTPELREFNDNLAVQETQTFKQDSYELDHSELTAVDEVKLPSNKLQNFVDNSAKIDRKWYNKLVSGGSRSATQITRLIIHHTVSSTAQSTFNTLVNRGLGIHYILDKDGTLYYAVDESLITYHAKNANSNSIGIEVVNSGNGKDPFTAQQYRSIRYIINQMSKKYPNFKPDPIHVLGHYHVGSHKKDPEVNFDWIQLGPQFAVHNSNRKDWAPFKRSPYA